MVDVCRYEKQKIGVFQSPEGSTFSFVDIRIPLEYSVEWTKW